MPEEITPPAGGDNPTPPAPAPNGTPPVKSDAAPNAGFQTSSIKDDDFAKLFDDPRLYQHNRFKELSAKAKKASEYEEQEKARKTEDMKKKGEFEQLAKQHEDEAKTWKQKATDAKVENALILEASKKGVQYPDAVLKLAERNLIKVGDDGSVTGITEAIDAAIKAYPTLLTINRSSTGAPTNPANPSDGAIKMSDVQNPAYYRAHEKEIVAAQSAGTIVDDRP